LLSMKHDLVELVVQLLGD